MTSVWERFSFWMSKDSLLVRVMCVNSGIALLAIAGLIVFSGEAAESRDSAIYIVVALLAAAGVYAIHSGVCFKKTLSRNDTIWLLDIWWLVIAIALMAVPITLLIRLFQNRNSNTQ